MSILALIPARGGSKRLPNKNLMKLGGASLVERAIRSAETPLITTICVSTDSEEIATEANRFGDFAPFIRPPRYAQDDSSSFAVVEHALEWYAGQGMIHEAVVVLQPTSPLRRSTHVAEALSLLERSGAEGVVSVCPVEHPVEWTAPLPENNSMTGFSAVGALRSQDYEPRFRINGAIYAYYTSALKQYGRFYYDECVKAYRMTVEDSVDIDTIEDFRLAEYRVRVKSEGL